MRKVFGPLVALDDVSLKVPAGSFHALLGENGAGKSTLVKCIMGFYQPDAGQVLVDGRGARDRQSARGRGSRHRHGLPAFHAGAFPDRRGESRDRAPKGPSIIDWKEERRALAAFLDRMPFRAPLDRPVALLSAGEKQKLEILKQLWLDQRFIILDEPTSVLHASGGRRNPRPPAGHDPARRGDRAHDHAQVPRGDGLRR